MNTVHFTKQIFISLKEKGLSRSKEALDLEDEVLHAGHVADIVHSVEQFLIKKGGQVQHTDLVFEESLALIYRHKGILTIEELLKKIPVTETR